MKHLLVVVLLGALLLIVGCSKNEEKSNGVQEEISQERNVVEAFGIVKAKDVQNIMIDFNASVEAVHIQEGQQVKEGDVLITLNMKDYEAAMKSKSHELNIVQLEKNRLQDDLLEDEQNDPNIKKVVNALRLAEDLYIQAQKDLASQEVLYRSGVISQSEFENYKKIADTRYKEQEDARYDLENIQKEKKKDIEDLKIKNEKIAVVASELQRMKEKSNKEYIQKNTIVANIDNGIVYDINYQAGDLIDASKKILSLLNLDTMIVEAEVAEEFIRDVKVGADVEIIPLSNKEIIYKGKVSRISQRAIEKNGETIIPVEITIDNNDGVLMPNFNVDVVIQITK